MKKRIVWLLIAVMTLVTLLPGCSQNSTPSAKKTAATSKQIDVLRVGTTMEFKSKSREDLNLICATYGLNQMWLVTHDEHGNYQPALATKWSTEDSKLWKLEIRDDIYWHDGVKVTPDDVKFSIEYRKANTPVGGSQFGQVQSITVTGKNSLEIQLATPNSRFLDFYITILPKHIFEKVNDYMKYTEDNGLLGDGPYRISKIDTENSVLEMEAVDSYYMGKPNIKKIVFTTYKTPDTMYMALQNGDIDMIYNYARGIDSSIIDTFKSNKNIKLKVMPNIGLPAALFLNVTAEPVNRLEVREAIRYALDYDKMVELFGSQYASAPEAGALPKGSYGYKDCGKLKRDLKKSKELLKSIGCTDSNGDGIYELNGKKLEVEVTVNSEKVYMVRMAEKIKTDLGEAGIGVAIKSVDGMTYQTISQKDHTHVALLGCITPAGMCTAAGAGTAYDDARFHGWCMVKDPEFQNLTNTMLATTDTEKYKKLAGQVQDYNSANATIIPLYNDKFVFAYSSKLDNLKYDYLYGLLNAYTVYSITKTE